jgi:vacuolar-type H+-ATPase subunit H
MSTTLNISSIIASIVSVVIAILAIWLSIVFYKMSSKLSVSTNDAAKGISSSVERLEKLFDKLYSDTFSMMRDTVSDMRHHLWPAKDRSEEITEIESEAQEKAGVLLKEIEGKTEKELSSILAKQKITEDRIVDLREEMLALINRVLVESKEADAVAKKEVLREKLKDIMRGVSDSENKMMAREIVGRAQKLKFDFYEVLGELYKMKADKIIDFATKEIEPQTIIELKKE